MDEARQPTLPRPYGELYVAFAIPRDQYQNWERRLAEHGVSIEHRRAWSRGGPSIYFRDPVRHLVGACNPMCGACIE